MSETSQHIVIQTAGDPRHWPEFAQLRDEINKISHPAQPPVNWPHIETLALTLFHGHGVDLQTAVYYTLARTQLHGLAGFTDGCELLSALVVNHWESLWPPQPQHRQEILEWFNGRIGHPLRQQELTAEDLRLVYRAERALQLLCDKLQQVELKRVPRLDNLLGWMQNTAKRLETAKAAAKPAASKPLDIAPVVCLAVPKAAPQPPQANNAVRVNPPPARHRFINGFAAGLVFSALIALAVYFSAIRPLQQQWLALMAKPESAVQLWFLNPTLASYPEQLQQLERLSPFAGLRTAEQTLALARQQWPADPRQRAASQRFERLVQARADSNTIDNSYAQLNKQLQELSATLLERERSRGSLTLSYLKTAVYQMQSELNRTVPLEALLRQLAQAVASGNTPPPLLIKQIDDRWNALLSHYDHLMQQADAAP